MQGEVIQNRSTHWNDPSSEDIDPGVLADIYNDGTDIAIWKRELPRSIRSSVAEFVDACPSHRTELSATPDQAQDALTKALGEKLDAEVTTDMADLVGMFCMLFDLERAGIRLSVLHNAMCPKFHVDRIPCRLVTTYQGIATEWLPHDCVDRSKLGHGSNSKPDHESGLFLQSQDIQQLRHGDIALLKGDSWKGSEGKGLVHRSPRILDTDRRLLLTLDIIN